MVGANLENGNDVAIGRLDCHYLVPREHPWPASVTSELDAIVATRLANACGRVIDRVLEPRDPAVWVIRRLEFSLSLDPGCAEQDEIAAAWGACLAKAIARLIALGPDGATVLRFADRPRYIAAFL